MRRCELRFGLLGPPVLYDRPPFGISCNSSDAHSGDPAAAGTRTRTSASAALATPRQVPDDTFDNGVRAIGSPKVRALLAALLLEPGRVVSVESLKDALWGGAPPVSAQASLHNHVTRLRRLLDDPDRLRAVPPGYLLRVDQGELDVHVFDARVAEARAAHARGDWPGVVRACAAALALWRGTPLSGLPADLGGYALVQRLQEARRLLLEWRYDAELALGGSRLAGIVPELAALVAEYPLREAYHRQLMLALHRTGRHAEALAVHRDLRARLIEELGVEPGPAVREAHVEVLRGSDEGGQRAEEERDSRQAGAVHQQVGAADDLGGTEEPAETPSGREDGVPSDTRPAPRPAQLPPPPAHFTGRVDVRRALRQALTEPAAPAPAVAVLSGMAGVGKSALALHVAHELRERFTDGQLYVNLHGATPGMTPLTSVQALAALLRDLGVAPRSIPEHPDAAAALLRSLLAPARVLLVLDDAATAAQVRPLLPAGPGCAVIVTSRSPLTALDGARRFPLGPLTGEDSAALLRAVSGREGLDAGHALVELTGRLPLALRVVAARLAARRALTPDVLAGQLAETGGRLRHLEYDDLSVRRSLAVAHDALAAAQREADRDAALALRRIGALDLPTYGAPLIARLTGIDERRAEAALDRLVDVALLEETTYGRYAPHDLVRDFARELADADAGEEEKGRREPGASLGTGSGAVSGTRTDASVGTGSGAVSGTRPDASVGTGSGAVSGTRPDASVGTGSGTVSSAGADASVGTGSGTGAGALPGTESGAVSGTAPGVGSCSGSCPDQAVRAAHAATTASTAVSTPPAAPATGAASARTAVAGSAAAPDPPAIPAQEHGHPREHGPAPDHGRAPGHGPASAPDLTALRWYAAVAERVLEAVVEAGIDLDDRRRPTSAQPPEHAADVAGLARFESAEQAHGWGDVELENVVALVSRNADTADPVRAAHLSTLARLLFPYVQRAGRVAEMEVLGRAALGAARRLGDAAAEAYALGDLAAMHFLTGRQKDALALTDRSLEIWRQLGVLSRIRRSLNNRGLLLEGLGRYAESEEALRQSLAYSRQLNDPYGEAVTHSHLGNLYEHTDPRAAIEQHRLSLAIGNELGAVIVQHSAHCNIGYAHLTLGEPAAAARHFEESLRILGDHGDWHGESQTRLGLVRALRQLGETERAARECAELLRRADARADRYMGGLARHQHGLLLSARGRRTEAYDTWRAALAALDGTDEQAIVAELRDLLAE
ncbi:BTAD domain-containing putative transcriptional regulator [Streptomyces sp. NBC_00557]|uniref:BTAD domain-containing putative transcriptional regulator n=1 Tax=Streptomyces sp. NBC_00557 TaxID=2975776 RepID=UPI002E824567|nr:BTAD domain-containing putative transcriptional regulator [Streptomyces sp. NBC_00557]WUC35588.1 tetratricopeptide repeat protein [Streptomyces sp. NBC_00557]